MCRERCGNLKLKTGILISRFLACKEAPKYVKFHPQKNLPFQAPFEPGELLKNLFCQYLSKRLEIFCVSIILVLYLLVSFSS